MESAAHGRTVYAGAVLHLASRTDPAWGAWAVRHVDEILVDHAHLEKRAAATAINLTFRYAEHEALARPLSALAREELEHFESVLEVLARRAVAYRRVVPSPYAERLKQACRTTEPLRLVDTLLCCSLIEARSCERMRILADALKAAGEAELAALYHGLLACEARHHATYVDLSRSLRLVPDADLTARLAVLAQHEAEVIAGLPVAPRLHDQAAGENSSTA